MKSVLSWLLSLSVIGLLLPGALKPAHALPAFALREKVSCVMCHTNGSAPHLNEYGYLYRRAGFRPPTSIGDREADDKAMNFLDHMAVGVAVDYEWASTTPPGPDAHSYMLSNHVNVPEISFWPLVGGFYGNYGVWSEIDASPTTTGGGSVDLSQADLRYVTGNENMFFNFRAGLMASEGFGASDQWLDDANIPVMDQLTPYFNQDTLAIPFGAMNIPQLGAEFGLNYMRSHLTFGVYNGFSGANTAGNATTSLTPALMARNKGISKDFKVQMDQFVSDLGAITAAFYQGTIRLMDPTGTAFPWYNNFKQGRLYFTAYALPSVLDLFAGGALARNQYVTGNTEPDGSFQSRGAFIGTNYYVMPHLTLGARADYYQFNTETSARAKANGYSVQASLPFENNLYILHFNVISTEIANATFPTGLSKDLRAEWRFIF